MKSLQQRGIARTQLIVFLATVLLVLTMIGGGYLLLHDPRTPVRKTADTFMDALAKDNATTTYNLFTSKLKKQTSSNAWRQQVNASFSGYKNKPTYISTTTVPDPYHVYKSYADPTRVMYSFNFSGKIYDMSIVLLKNSGDKNAIWQVDEWETHLQ